MAQQRGGSLVGLVMTALLLAGLAGSVVQFVAKHLSQLGPVTTITMVLFAGLMLLVFRVFGRVGSQGNERRLVLIVLGVTFVLKLGLVFIWREFPQSGDRLYLAQFVEQWETGGDEALRELSRHVYDYPVWAGRSWPFLYPVRLLFREHFVFATQILNCLLSTAVLEMIYRLTRRITTRPLLPFALAAVSPVFFWSVLDYAYQFQSALFLLFAFALSRAETRGHLEASGPGSIMRRCVLGLVLFLLHLQQGLDLILLALMAAMAGYQGWISGSIKQFQKVACALILVPALIWLPLSKTSDHWIDQRDEGKLSSGFIGHMAYGWNLVTWGEFYGPVIVLDRNTPAGQKQQVMARYIIDQIRERPFDALVRLPVIKTIKLPLNKHETIEKITFLHKF